MLRSFSPKSETAGAMRYALSRWRALTRYIDDGWLEIDNGAAERALRAVALGRKTTSSPATTPAANAPPSKVSSDQRYAEFGIALIMPRSRLCRMVAASF